MSKSRDQTEPTPQSSSDERIEGLGPPSEPSAKAEPTNTSTASTSLQSADTSKGSNGGRSEIDYLHAEMMKVSLQVLEKAGLIKRYLVQSKSDPTTVVKVRYEFDLQHWTEDLELK